MTVRAHADEASGQEPECESETQAAHGRPWIFLAVCALGVSSIVTQLVLMRELLCVFAGNELVFGIVLGSWLLTTGLGTFLGRGAPRLTHPISVLVAAQLLVATLPLVDVVLVRVLPDVIFAPGAQVGVVGTAVSSVLLLLPYCVVAGYLLALACCALARAGAASIGQVYFLDNLGDIAGGLFFTVAIVFVANHFHLLYVPAALNLATALLLAWKLRQRAALLVATAVTIATIGVVVGVDLDAMSTARQYPGQNVLLHTQSPFGNLVVTESQGQLNFIESGVPLFSTQEVEEVEETVHYAMAQRPQAHRVLLISGGLTGTAEEVLKYGVEAVDYVELDPVILRAARRFVPENLDDPRIEAVVGDGRRFVRSTDRRYGVVIVDLPDPSTAQINRFYTVEFFHEVKRILEPGGVVAISLAHYENVVSPELAGLLSVGKQTLRSAFTNTLIIPGGSVYLLASDGPLSRDVFARIRAARVQTELVRPGYLSAVLAADRVGEVERALSADAPLNTDLRPVLYFRQMIYWTRQLGGNVGLLALGVGVFMAAYLLRVGPVPMALFTTGCAASTLEVVVLFGLQMVHGFVYARVGLVVTLSLVGLAIGSALANRVLARLGRQHLVALEIGIAVFAALVPVALIAAGALARGSELGNTASADVVFPILAFAPGVLVGLEFPLAARVEFDGVGRTASRLYTADFMGACLGAVVVGAVLIPVLGVVWVCVLTAALNIASGLWVWSTRQG